MKTILFATIFTLFYLFSNAQKGSFSGKIEGIGNAEISVLVLPLKLGVTPISETIHCENGKFECEIDFNLNMWHLVRLNSVAFHSVFGDEKTQLEGLKNREIIFFIYPGDKLTIDGKTGKYGIDYKISGNEIGNQSNRFSQQLFPMEEELNRLTILKAALTEGDVKQAELDKQIHKVKIRMENAELELIAAHPDWVYSAEIVAEFPNDTIARYFKTFTSDVQNSFFGIHLSKILNAAAVGSAAPGFTLKNEKGKDVSLNDFEGKYVVLEFWGTWCGYCIKELPRLKTCYSKYHDKVEFIGIAYKDNRQTWLKAISKYELSWTNLIAENDEVREKYGVEGFPTKIIIDKVGKIVLKTTGESDEFYLKMDELFGKKQ
jgi:peroxiredoxin